jgi:hypothetical protein
MKILLLTDPTTTSEFVSEVVNILQSISGPVEIDSVPEGVLLFEDSSSTASMTDYSELSWPEIISGMQQYRSEYKIPEDHYLFLLSERPNDHRWFSFGDGMKNHYVHIAEWEIFIKAPGHLPVSFLIAGNVLLDIIFKDLDDLLANAHQTVRGCLSDLCINKTEISLKLRTADLCPECMDRLNNAVSADKLTGGEAQHLLNILESVRAQLLYRERFCLEMKPSRLTVKGYRRKLILEDLGGVQLDLNPKERTLYVMLLKYPEGLFPHMLDNNRFKAELSLLYGQLSGRSNSEQIEQTVKSFSDPELLNQVVSRIRGKIRRTLGEEMALPYLVQTDSEGRRLVPLDRAFVSFEDSDI